MRLRVLWVALFAALFLSGCVNYEVGVNFDNPNQGELVQHIKLGEQLTSFSTATVQEWLDSIERRTRQLQGRTRKISKQELIVTIPFASGAELQEKFNKFFSPIDKKGAKATTATQELPEINSRLKVNQNNLLFFVRNRLSYDLDLRSLGVISNNGNVLISPGAIIDLEFSLKTPWGARSVQNKPDAITPVINKGHQLVWKLQPGQVNHIEAVFWLPSPLGIGTLVIVSLVLGGFFLKYKQLPFSDLNQQLPATSN